MLSLMLDPRIGYKSPFSLVEFIDINVDLEKELEEFEGSFERDEVVDLWLEKIICWLKQCWKKMFVH
jgi:hypothetical protein